MIHLDQLDTEQRNPNTMHIDELSTEGMIRLINQEDHRVADAVGLEIPNITRAVDLIYAQLKQGGRLVYIGAGTSGRLGVLDASECPPTYGVSQDLVVGLIAGGEHALTHAAEGVEDHPEAGETDLKAIGFSARDALVGIAASGRTPYVLGAMRYAASLGAPIIALTNTSGSELSEVAQVTIAPKPGPEVVTGSTRMKSGTAQKMVLNMLSTAVMIKLGKVYGNLMVDVQATNEKLVRRCQRIVCAATGADAQAALEALEACGYHCKTAIVMLLLHQTAEEAKTALTAAEGQIARAVKAVQA